MGLPWAEREAFEEQYGTFFVELLLEVLGLIDEVEARRLSAYEAGAKAKAHFRELMFESQPACRAKVRAHQAKIAAEQCERNAEAARYEEKRQQAIRGETLRIEKAATDRDKGALRSRNGSREKA